MEVPFNPDPFSSTLLTPFPLHLKAPLKFRCVCPAFSPPIYLNRLCFLACWLHLLRHLYCDDLPTGTDLFFCRDGCVNNDLAAFDFLNFRPNLQRDSDRHGPQIIDAQRGCDKSKRE